MASDPTDPPDGYAIRVATIADVDALVSHRVNMFREMGLTIDESTDAQIFRRWLVESMQSNSYRAWVAGDVDGAVVAGGGITILPWPPGPNGTGGPLPFVYNVYTEPSHRRRGLARAIMETIHAWCRDAGYRRIGLAASASGQKIYEAMGYRAPAQPHLFLKLS